MLSRVWVVGVSELNNRISKSQTIISRLIEISHDASTSHRDGKTLRRNDRLCELMLMFNETWLNKKSDFVQRNVCNFSEEGSGKYDSTAEIYFFIIIFSWYVRFTLMAGLRHQESRSIVPGWNWIIHLFVSERGCELEKLCNEPKRLLLLLSHSLSPWSSHQRESEDSDEKLMVK